MTKVTQVHKDELNRSGMKNLPVNLLYPADYPDSPAIMLPEIISPEIALEALSRVAPKEPEKKKGDGPTETAGEASNKPAG